MAALWLLLRVRWRRSLVASLAVALLIGVIGGFVLASAAAARRVENAYAAFSAKIDAPDVAIIPAVDCAPSSGTGCDAPAVGSDAQEVLATVRASAVVEQARLVEAVIPFITDASGTAIFGTIDDANACYDGDRSMQMVAAADAPAKGQVVPLVLEGELPSRGSATVVITRSSALRVGLSIGDELVLAGRCTGDGDPVVFEVPIVLRISGLSIGPLDVESPATGLTIHPVYVDPAAFDALIAFGAEPQQNIVTWFEADASPADIEEMLRAFTVTVDFQDRQTTFDDALQTEANLLWLLVAVGAVGGLLVLAPVVGRNMRDTGPNTETLAALGAHRRQIARQALVHGCSLAVIGALTAVLVAIPVSAFMPSGLASAINPRREFWFDGRAAAVGGVVLIAAVVLMGAIPAWRIGRVDRLAAAVESTSNRGALGSLGLRPAVRTGVSAAVGAPAGRRGSSPWPSLLSMVVAAVVGVASLTYLAGLRHLEQTPRVVGWNWDAIVSFDFFDDGDGTSTDVFAEIGKLAEVEEVTPGTFFPPWFLLIEGTELSVWPWSFDTGPNAVTPAILSGRAPEGPDEIAIDAQFAEETGLGVGDTVTLGRQTLTSLMAGELTDVIEDAGVEYPLPDLGEQVPVAEEFEIVGLALMAGDPAQELSEVAFTLAGFADLVEPPADEVAATRAWLPDDLPPELVAVADDVFANLDVEDRVVYVRFVGDVREGAEAILNMDIVDDLTRVDPVDGTVYMPFEIVAPTPAEVMELMVGLNIERNDRVPVALAIMVAVAFFALATYLLFVSIRSRRFEMAVMRALGLSTRGIRWSVAAQATATAVIALLIAMPIGVLVGRWAWLDYARELEVMPVAIIPWATLAMVAAAAIVIANIVALLPGWFAARRSPGYDLRSE